MPESQIETCEEEDREVAVRLSRTKARLEKQLDTLANHRLQTLHSHSTVQFLTLVIL